MFIQNNDLNFYYVCKNFSWQIFTTAFAMRNFCLNKSTDIVKLCLVDYATCVGACLRKSMAKLSELCE